METSAACTIIVALQQRTSLRSPKWEGEGKGERRNGSFAVPALGRRIIYAKAISLGFIIKAKLTLHAGDSGSCAQDRAPTTLDLCRSIKVAFPGESFSMARRGLCEAEVESTDSRGRRQRDFLKQALGFLSKQSSRLR